MRTQKISNEEVICLEMSVICLKPTFHINTMSSS